MPCLPAAVSLALIVAQAPTPGSAAAPSARATTPAPPPPGYSPWRCGDSPVKYRPEDKVAQKYWREQTDRLAATDPEGRIAVLAEAWAQTRDPCFLVFTARANEQQGHVLLAYEQALELRAMGGEQRTPREVVEFIAAVQDGARDCDVTLTPSKTEAPASAAIVLTYEGLTPGDDLTGRCVTTACAQKVVITQEHKQTMRVGRWTLTTEAGSEFTPDSAGPGEPPNRRTIVVDHCLAPRALTLKSAAIPMTTPKPLPPGTTPPGGEGPGTDGPRRSMHRLSNLGVGIGAGLLIGGGVVLAVGAARWSSVFGAGLSEGCNAADLNGTAGCRAALAGPTQLRGVGAGIFGAGAGLLIPAMALRRAGAERRAVWLPVVGGVMTAIGATLVGVGASRYNAAYGAESTVPWADRAGGSMHLHTVGGALTGLGVGMLGASLARCVWRGACAGGRGDGRPRVAGVDVGARRLPGGAGLAISGRF